MQHHDQGKDGRLVDRFRGALVGTAVGDALGAPMEGRLHVPDAYLEAILDEPPALSYTDDTAMTLGVASALLASGGFDGARMARELADRYDAEPWRGYGSGPPQVFARLDAGEDWDRAAETLFGGEGSYGNGAAMRVAPVALFAFPDKSAVADLARRTARVTHTHPEGIDGAVCQAVAVADVLAEAPGSDPVDVVEAIRPHLRTKAFLHALDHIVASIGDDIDVRDTLGTGVAARESVPTALAVFLKHGESVTDTVRAAIALGGDTDTIAAMAGALAGARHGLRSFPEAWRRVEGTGELVALADAFAARRHDRP